MTAITDPHFQQELHEFAIEHCFFFPVFQKSSALPACRSGGGPREGAPVPGAGLNTNTPELRGQPRLVPVATVPAGACSQ